MYKNRFYDELQVLFKEGTNHSDRDRLMAAVGPLLSWYRAHRRDLPWRENQDAYRVWISEIMLQQTRVEAVKPYFARFMEHFPTVGALADADEAELLKCWEGLGYYSRARNLKKAAGLILEEYGGVLPASYDALLSLPGVGSYTAGAIASIAYNIPVPAVDGNVLRVLSRVLGSYDDILKQSTKRKMEGLVREVIPEGEAGDFNQALIETGAIVCVPNKTPLCGDCPFFSVCVAREQGLMGELPVKTPKKKRKIEEKTVLMIGSGDKIAIRRRKDEGLLASLYEFPNFPGRLSKEDVEEKLKSLCGGDIRVSELLKTRDQEENTQWLELPAAKHIFTHTEWHMGGFFLTGIDSGLLEAFPKDWIFVQWEEIKERYPVPNAFSVYKSFLEKWNLR